MDKITKFEIVPLNQSRFVEPYRIMYTQDGVNKVWDAVKSHDSVGILIYDTSLKCLVLVKQFRPVVYQSRIKDMAPEATGCLPHGSLGVTHEICAGIVDKDKSLEDIAVDDVWEECGYRVPASRLEKIAVLRSGVGLLGSSMTLFYLPVSQDDKHGSGGGNTEEGELIELYMLPRSEIDSFVSNDDIQKPTSVMFALLWFQLHRANQGHF